MLFAHHRSKSAHDSLVLTQVALWPREGNLASLTPCFQANRFFSSALYLWLSLG